MRQGNIIEIALSGQSPQRHPVQWDISEKVPLMWEDYQNSLWGSKNPEIHPSVCADHSKGP